VGGRVTIVRHLRVLGRRDGVASAWIEAPGSTARTPSPHVRTTGAQRPAEYTDRVVDDPTTCVVVIRAWWEPDFRARLILDRSPDPDANSVVIASLDDLLDTLRAYFTERRP